MKKKLLLLAFALGAFFLASCENMADLLAKDPPRNLGFSPNELSADTATEGVTAGSFSAEGGSGSLSYSLIEGEDDEDNGKFTVKANQLTVKSELGEGEYYFRARAEDSEGKSVEKGFTLIVGPAEDTDAPDVPDVPGVPGQPNTPGQGGGPASAKPARASAIESSPGFGFVDLRWGAADRATSYEVYYNTADDFASATKFAEEPTGTSLKVRGLAHGTVYNFWVVAKNAGGSASESRRHTAVKTSHDIPAYLKAHLIPGGPVEHYVATNLGWPGGDYYEIQDRGEEYPAEERYYFGYGSLGYTPGIVKYVRQFANPPEEPAVGAQQGGGYLYDHRMDINRGVIIYEYTDRYTGEQKFQATYYLNEHVAPIHSHVRVCHAPEAVMGQANGYTSGLGNDQTSNTLDAAIDTFAKIGPPGV
jgi:hypothetical protein